ncbi:MAG: hypothetical protein HUK22_05150, partial [Thermoguttaceae bacterium]|nr:hypothetical protein [Thermoguttaceae bacterium]
NLVDGDGAFENNGLVGIYNKSGVANQAFFGQYSDSASGALVATGDVVMASGKMGGEVEIKGLLEADSWTSLSDAAFVAGSNVKVAGLATVGRVDDPEGGEDYGASLFIEGASEEPKDANVVLGGLKAVSTVVDGKIEGGALNIDVNAPVQITGLEKKMNAAGEIDAKNGKYDVWLGSNFEIDGMLFSAQTVAADDKEGENETKLGTLGVRWLGESTISEVGALKATDLNVSVAAESGKDAKLTNSGAMTVEGKFAVELEDGTQGFVFENLAEEDQQASIGSWTIGENQSFVNGSSTAVADMTVNELTIAGGSLETVGKSTLTVDKLTLESGEMTLGSTVVGGGLAVASNDYVITKK